MQLKQPIGASLTAAACGLLGTLPHVAVAADDSDRWQADTALFYWGEGDGRVQDMSLRAAVHRALGDDSSVDANLTIDTLTGASPSGAVLSNSVQTFTRPSGAGSYQVPADTTPLDDSFLDTRVAIAGTWQQALGESMRWKAGVTASGEFDYQHYGANAWLERDFNLRNTTLYAGAAIGRDDIRPVGGAPLPLTAMRGVGDNSSKLADDSKDVLDALLGITQILTRRSLVEITYSYGQSTGYLTDPYKVLTVVDAVSGLPVAGSPGSGLNLYLYERRPDSRTKHSVFGEWRHAFDRDSFALSYRFMADDWGIRSHTVEGRYRRNLRPGLYIEPHLRYYQQGAADFYRTELVNGAILPQFASADYRLAQGDALTAGLKLGRPSPDGEFSVRLEYYRQTAEPSAGSGIGYLANRELVPPLSAVIAQFGYKFSF